MTNYEYRLMEIKLLELLKKIKRSPNKKDHFVILIAIAHVAGNKRGTELIQEIYKDNIRIPMKEITAMTYYLLPDMGVSNKARLFDITRRAVMLREREHTKEKCLNKDYLETLMPKHITSDSSYKIVELINKMYEFFLLELIETEINDLPRSKELIFWSVYSQLLWLFDNDKEFVEDVIRCICEIKNIKYLNIEFHINHMDMIELKRKSSDRFNSKFVSQITNLYTFNGNNKGTTVVKMFHRKTNTFSINTSDPLEKLKLTYQAVFPTRTDDLLAISKLFFDFTDYMHKKTLLW